MAKPRKRLDLLIQYRRWREALLDCAHPSRIPLSDSFRKKLDSAVVEEWALHCWQPPRGIYMDSQGIWWSTSCDDVQEETETSHNLLTDEDGPGGNGESETFAERYTALGLENSLRCGQPVVVKDQFGNKPRDRRDGCLILTMDSHGMDLSCHEKSHSVHNFQTPDRKLTSRGLQSTEYLTIRHSRVQKKEPCKHESFSQECQAAERSQDIREIKNSIILERLSHYRLLLQQICDQLIKREHMNTSHYYRNVWNTKLQAEFNSDYHVTPKHARVREVYDFSITWKACDSRASLKSISVAHRGLLQTNASHGSKRYDLDSCTDAPHEVLPAKYQQLIFISFTTNLTDISCHEEGTPHERTSRCYNWFISVIVITDYCSKKFNEKRIIPTHASPEIASLAVLNSNNNSSHSNCHSRKNDIGSRGSQNLDMAWRVYKRTHSFTCISLFSSQINVHQNRTHSRRNRYTKSRPVGARKTWPILALISNSLSSASGSRSPIDSLSKYPGQQKNMRKICGSSNSEYNTSSPFVSHFSCLSALPASSLAHRHFAHQRRHQHNHRTSPASLSERSSYRDITLSISFSDSELGKRKKVRWTTRHARCESPMTASLSSHCCKDSVSVDSMCFLRRKGRNNNSRGFVKVSGDSNATSQQRKCFNCRKEGKSLSRMDQEQEFQFAQNQNMCFDSQMTALQSRRERRNHRSRPWKKEPPPTCQKVGDHGSIHGNLDLVKIQYMPEAMISHSSNIKRQDGQVRPVMNTLQKSNPGCIHGDGLDRVCSNSSNGNLKDAVIFPEVEEHLFDSLVQKHQSEILECDNRELRVVSPRHTQGNAFSPLVDMRAPLRWAVDRNSTRNKIKQISSPEIDWLGCQTGSRDKDIDIVKHLSRIPRPIHFQRRILKGESVRKLETNIDCRFKSEGVAYLSKEKRVMPVNHQPCQGDSGEVKKGPIGKNDDTETCKTSSTWNDETTASKSQPRERKKSSSVKPPSKRIFVDPRVTAEMQRKVKNIVQSYKDFLEKEAEQKRFDEATATAGASSAGQKATCIWNEPLIFPPQIAENRVDTGDYHHKVQTRVGNQIHSQGENMFFTNQSSPKQNTRSKCPVQCNLPSNVPRLQPCHFLSREHDMENEYLSQAWTDMDIEMDFHKYDLGNAQAEHEQLLFHSNKAHTHAPFSARGKCMGDKELLGDKDNKDDHLDFDIPEHNDKTAVTDIDQRLKERTQEVIDANRYLTCLISDKDNYDIHDNAGAAIASLQHCAQLHQTGANNTATVTPLIKTFSTVQHIANSCHRPQEVNNKGGQTERTDQRPNPMRASLKLTSSPKVTRQTHNTRAFLQSKKIYRGLVSSSPKYSQKLWNARHLGGVKIAESRGCMKTSPLLCSDPKFREKLSPTSIVQRKASERQKALTTKCRRWQNVSPKVYDHLKTKQKTDDKRTKSSKMESPELTKPDHERPAYESSGKISCPVTDVESTRRSSSWLAVKQWVAKAAVSGGQCPDQHHLTSGHLRRTVHGKMQEKRKDYYKACQSGQRYGTKPATSASREINDKQVQVMKGKMIRSRYCPQVSPKNPNSAHIVHRTNEINKQIRSPSNTQGQTIDTRDVMAMNGYVSKGKSPAIKNDSKDGRRSHNNRNKTVEHLRDHFQSLRFTRPNSQQFTQRHADGEDEKRKRAMNGPTSLAVEKETTHGGGEGRGKKLGHGQGINFLNERNDTGDDPFFKVKRLNSFEYFKHRQEAIAAIRSSRACPKHKASNWKERPTDDVRRAGKTVRQGTMPARQGQQVGRSPTDQQMVRTENEQICRGGITGKVQHRQHPRAEVNNMTSDTSEETNRLGDCTSVTVSKLSPPASSKSSICTAFVSRGTSYSSGKNRNSKQTAYGNKAGSMGIIELLSERVTSTSSWRSVTENFASPTRSQPGQPSSDIDSDSPGRRSEVSEHHNMSHRSFADDEMSSSDKDTGHSERYLSSMSTMRSIPELPYNCFSTDENPKSRSVSSDSLQRVKQRGVKQSSLQPRTVRSTAGYASRRENLEKKDYNFSNRICRRSASEPTLTTTTSFSHSWAESRLSKSYLDVHQRTVVFKDFMAHQLHSSRSVIKLVRDRLSMPSKHKEAINPREPIFKPYCRQTPEVAENNNTNSIMSDKIKSQVKNWSGSRSGSSLTQFLSELHYVFQQKNIADVSNNNSPVGKLHTISRIQYSPRSAIRPCRGQAVKKISLICSPKQRCRLRHKIRNRKKNNQSPAITPKNQDSLRMSLQEKFDPRSPRSHPQFAAILKFWQRYGPIVDLDCGKYMLNKQAFHSMPQLAQQPLPMEPPVVDVELKSSNTTSYFSVTEAEEASKVGRSGCDPTNMRTLGPIQKLSLDDRTQPQISKILKRPVPLPRKKRLYGPQLNISVQDENVGRPVLTPNRNYQLQKDIQNDWSRNSVRSLSVCRVERAEKGSGKKHISEHYPQRKQSVSAGPLNWTQFYGPRSRRGSSGSYSFKVGRKLLKQKRHKIIKRALRHFAWSAFPLPRKHRTYVLNCSESTEPVGSVLSVSPCHRKTATGPVRGFHMAAEQKSEEGTTGQLVRNRLEVSECQKLLRKLQKAIRHKVAIDDSIHQFFGQLLSDELSDSLPYYHTNTSSDTLFPQSQHSSEVFDNGLDNRIFHTKARKNRSEAWPVRLDRRQISKRQMIDIYKPTQYSDFLTDEKSSSTSHSTSRHSFNQPRKRTTYTKIWEPRQVGTPDSGYVIPVERSDRPPTMNNMFTHIAEDVYTNGTSKEDIYKPQEDNAHFASHPHRNKKKVSALNKDSHEKDWIESPEDRETVSSLPTANLKEIGRLCVERGGKAMDMHDISEMLVRNREITHAFNTEEKTHIERERLSADVTSDQGKPVNNTAVGTSLRQKAMGLSRFIADLNQVKMSVDSVELKETPYSRQRKTDPKLSRAAAVDRNSWRVRYAMDDMKTSLVAREDTGEIIGTVESEGRTVESPTPLLQETISQQPMDRSEQFKESQPASCSPFPTACDKPDMIRKHLPPDETTQRNKSFVPIDSIKYFQNKTLTKHQRHDDNQEAAKSAVDRILAKHMLDRKDTPRMYNNISSGEPKLSSHNKMYGEKMESLNTGRSIMIADSSSKTQPQLSSKLGVYQWCTVHRQGNLKFDRQKHRDLYGEVKVEESYSRMKDLESSEIATRVSVGSPPAGLGRKLADFEAGSEDQEDVLLTRRFTGMSNIEKQQNSTPGQFPDADKSAEQRSGYRIETHDGVCKQDKASCSCQTDHRYVEDQIKDPHSLQCQETDDRPNQRSRFQTDEMVQTSDAKAKEDNYVYKILQRGNQLYKPRLSVGTSPTAQVLHPASTAVNVKIKKERTAASAFLDPSISKVNGSESSGYECHGRMVSTFQLSQESNDNEDDISATRERIESTHIRQSLPTLSTSKEYVISTGLDYTSCSSAKSTPDRSRHGDGDACPTCTAHPSTFTASCSVFSKPSASSSSCTRDFNEPDYGGVHRWSQQRPVSKSNNMWELSRVKNSTEENQENSYDHTKPCNTCEDQSIHHNIATKTQTSNNKLPVVVSESCACQTRESLRRKTEHRSRTCGQNPSFPYRNSALVSAQAVANSQDFRDEDQTGGRIGKTRKDESNKQFIRETDSSEMTEISWQGQHVNIPKRYLPKVNSKGTSKAEVKVGAVQVSSITQPDICHNKETHTLRDMPRQGTTVSHAVAIQTSDPLVLAETDNTFKDQAVSKRVKSRMFSEKQTDNLPISGPVLGESPSKAKAIPQSNGSARANQTPTVRLEPGDGPLNVQWSSAKTFSDIAYLKLSTRKNEVSLQNKKTRLETRRFSSPSPRYLIAGAHHIRTNKSSSPSPREISDMKWTTSQVQSEVCQNTGKVDCGEWNETEKATLFRVLRHAGRSSSCANYREALPLIKSTTKLSPRVEESDQETRAMTGHRCFIPSIDRSIQNLSSKFRPETISKTTSPPPKSHAGNRDKLADQPWCGDEGARTEDIMELLTLRRTKNKQPHPSSVLIFSSNVTTSRDVSILGRETKESLEKMENEAPIGSRGSEMELPQGPAPSQESSEKPSSFPEPTQTFAIPYKLTTSHHTRPSLSAMQRLALSTVPNNWGDGSKDHQSQSHSDEYIVTTEDSLSVQRLSTGSQPPEGNSCHISLCTDDPRNRLISRRLDHTKGRKGPVLRTVRSKARLQSLNAKVPGRWSLSKDRRWTNRPPCDFLRLPRHESHRYCRKSAPPESVRMSRCGIDVNFNTGFSGRQFLMDKYISDLKRARPLTPDPSSDTEESYQCRKYQCNHEGFERRSSCYREIISTTRDALLTRNLHSHINNLSEAMRSNHESTSHPAEDRKRKTRSRRSVVRSCKSNSAPCYVATSSSDFIDDVFNIPFFRDDSSLDIQLQTIKSRNKKGTTSRGRECLRSKFSYHPCRHMHKKCADSKGAAQCNPYPPDVAFTDGTTTSSTKPLDSSTGTRDIEIVLGNDISVQEFMTCLVNGLHLQYNNSRLPGEESGKEASVNSEVRLVIDKIFGGEHSLSHANQDKPPTRQISSCRSTDNTPYLSPDKTEGAKDSICKVEEMPKQGFVSYRQTAQALYMAQRETDKTDVFLGQRPHVQRRDSKHKHNRSHHRHSVSSKYGTAEEDGGPFYDAASSQAYVTSTFDCLQNMSGSNKAKPGRQENKHPKRRSKVTKSPLDSRKIKTGLDKHWTNYYRSKCPSLLSFSVSDTILSPSSPRQFDRPYVERRKKRTSVVADQRDLSVQREAVLPSGHVIDMQLSTSAPVSNLAACPSSKLKKHHQYRSGSVNPDVRKMPLETIKICKPRNCCLEKVIRKNNKLTVTFTNLTKLKHYSRSPIDPSQSAGALDRECKRLKGLNEKLLEQESHCALLERNTSQEIWGNKDFVAFMDADRNTDKKKRDPSRQGRLGKMKTDGAELMLQSRPALVPMQDEGVQTSTRTDKDSYRDSNTSNDAAETTTVNPTDTAVTIDNTADDTSMTIHQIPTSLPLQDISIDLASSSAYGYGNTFSHISSTTNNVIKSKPLSFVDEAKPNPTSGSGSWTTGYDVHACGAQIVEGQCLPGKEPFSEIGDVILEISNQSGTDSLTKTTLDSKKPSDLSTRALGHSDQEIRDVIHLLGSLLTRKASKARKGRPLRKRDTDAIEEVLEENTNSSEHHQVLPRTVDGETDIGSKARQETFISSQCRSVSQERKDKQKSGKSKKKSTAVTSRSGEPAEPFNGRMSVKKLDSTVDHILHVKLKPRLEQTVPISQAETANQQSRTKIQQRMDGSGEHSSVSEQSCQTERDGSPKEGPDHLTALGPRHTQNLYVKRCSSETTRRNEPSSEDTRLLTWESTSSPKTTIPFKCTADMIKPICKKMKTSPAKFPPALASNSELVADKSASRNEQATREPPVSKDSEFGNECQKKSLDGPADGRRSRSDQDKLSKEGSHMAKAQAVPQKPATDDVICNVDPSHRSAREVKIKAPCSVYTGRNSVSVSLATQCKSDSEGVRCVKLIMSEANTDQLCELVVEADKRSEGPSKIVADNGFVHVSFDASVTDDGNISANSDIASNHTRERKCSETPEEKSTSEITSPRKLGRTCRNYRPPVPVSSITPAADGSDVHSSLTSEFSPRKPSIEPAAQSQLREIRSSPPRLTARWSMLPIVTSKRKTMDFAKSPTNACHSDKDNFQDGMSYPSQQSGQQKPFYLKNPLESQGRQITRRMSTETISTIRKPASLSPPSPLTHHRTSPRAIPGTRSSLPLFKLGLTSLGISPTRLRLLSPTRVTNKKIPPSDLPGLLDLTETPVTGKTNELTAAGGKYSPRRSSPAESPFKNTDLFDFPCKRLETREKIPSNTSLSHQVNDLIERLQQNRGLQKSPLPGENRPQAPILNTSQAATTRRKHSDRMNDQRWCGLGESSIEKKHFGGDRTVRVTHESETINTRELGSALFSKILRDRSPISSQESSSPLLHKPILSGGRLQRTDMSSNRPNGPDDADVAFSRRIRQRPFRCSADIPNSGSPAPFVASNNAEISQTTPMDLSCRNTFSVKARAIIPATDTQPALSDVRAISPLDISNKVTSNRPLRAQVCNQVCTHLGDKGGNQSSHNYYSESDTPRDGHYDRKCWDDNRQGRKNRKSAFNCDPPLPKRILEDRGGGFVPFDYESMRSPNRCKSPSPRRYTGETRYTGDTRCTSETRYTGETRCTGETSYTGETQCRGETRYTNESSLDCGRRTIARRSGDHTVSVCRSRDEMTDCKIRTERRAERRKRGEETESSTPCSDKSPRRNSFMERGLSSVLRSSLSPRRDRISDSETSSVRSVTKQKPQYARCRTKRTRPQPEESSSVSTEESPGAAHLSGRSSRCNECDTSPKGRPRRWRSSERSDPEDMSAASTPRENHDTKHRDKYRPGMYQARFRHSRHQEESSPSRDECSTSTSIMSTSVSRTSTSPSSLKSYKYSPDRCSHLDKKPRPIADKTSRQVCLRSDSESDDNTGTASNSISSGSSESAEEEKCPPRAINQKSKISEEKRRGFLSKDTKKLMSCRSQKMSRPATSFSSSSSRDSSPEQSFTSGKTVSRFSPPRYAGQSRRLVSRDGKTEREFFESPNQSRSDNEDLCKKTTDMCSPTDRAPLSPDSRYSRTNLCASKVCNVCKGEGTIYSPTGRGRTCYSCGQRSTESSLRVSSPRTSRVRFSDKVTEFCPPYGEFSTARSRPSLDCASRLSSKYNFNSMLPGGSSGKHNFNYSLSGGSSSPYSYKRCGHSSPGGRYTPRFHAAIGINTSVCKATSSPNIKVTPNDQSKYQPTPPLLPAADWPAHLVTPGVPSSNQTPKESSQQTPGIQCWGSQCQLVQNHLQHPTGSPVVSGTSSAFESTSQSQPGTRTPFTPILSKPTASSSSRVVKIQEPHEQQPQPPSPPLSPSQYQPQPILQQLHQCQYQQPQLQQYPQQLPQPPDQCQQSLQQALQQYQQQVEQPPCQYSQSITPLQQRGRPQPRQYQCQGNLTSSQLQYRQLSRQLQQKKAHYPRSKVQPATHCMRTGSFVSGTSPVQGGIASKYKPTPVISVVDDGRPSSSHGRLDSGYCTSVDCLSEWDLTIQEKIDQRSQNLGKVNRTSTRFV